MVTKKQAKNKIAKYETVNLRLPIALAAIVAANPEEAVAFLEAELNKPQKAMEAPRPLLYKAADIIAGARQSDYGACLQNFSQIAMLFQGTLATKLIKGAQITPEDVAMLMIQVKIARLAKNPDHKDSILDVAGYAGCYDILQNERDGNYELLGATHDARSRGIGVYAPAEQE